MATPAKSPFAAMVGAKRRRMKSGGNASTIASNTKKEEPDLSDIDDDDEMNTQTSKCKGATTIPIFLKKTYKMIESCDPSISAWTPDGEMFVVKDPDRFATNVIPQYFDHNKFSSFARQLNFYGFRKMQSKPIKNSDFDVNTAKHVTFYNENFKRGRCDLLKKIQRSTRGGGSSGPPDQSREVQALKETIDSLEQKIEDNANQMEERMRRLELDMLGRMEQMVLAIQQQQVQHSNNVEAPKAPGSKGVSIGGPSGMVGWDPLPFGARGTSIGSISGLASLTGLSILKAGEQGGPTLPPHPKQKSLPPQGLPGALTIPPASLETLRGISNLSRGLSIESQSSALFSSGFEDKFFSMLMSGERANQASTGMNPTPMNPNGTSSGMVSNGGKMGV